MTGEQKATYINSQVLCAQIEIEAMKVGNVVSVQAGMGPIYFEQDFRALIDKFVIEHNDVLGIFHP